MSFLPAVLRAVIRCLCKQNLINAFGVFLPSVISLPFEYPVGYPSVATRAERRQSIATSEVLLISTLQDRQIFGIIYAIDRPLV